MGADNRNTANHLGPLLEQLRREPYRFTFFAAARLVEASRPDLPRLGQAAKASAEPVRFGQQPSLVFPPASIHAFRPAGDAGEDRAERARAATWLLVHFLGLLGPNGPLPLHLTEYELDRRYGENDDRTKPHDDTFSRFLDIFNHRILTLFYRSWAQAQPCASRDRPKSDRFGEYVAAIAGLGTPALRNRDAMPDLAKLHYAGLLACQARPPDGLRAILAGILQLRVEVHELVGQWLSIPRGQLWQLGRSVQTSTLGLNTTLGPRVRAHQHKFRVRLGPLRLTDYMRFLPGKELIQLVRAVVRNYAGDQWDWDLQLVLAHAEVPGIRLGQQGQLGWTTWLPRVASERDPDDLLLEAAVMSSTAGTSAHPIASETLSDRAQASAQMRGHLS
jgi:type VI secretion system protein ImpH